MPPARPKYKPELITLRKLVADERTMRLLQRLSELGPGELQTRGAAAAALDMHVSIFRYFKEPLKDTPFARMPFPDLLLHCFLAEVLPWPTDLVDEGIPERIIRWTVRHSIMRVHIDLLRATASLYDSSVRELLLEARKRDRARTARKPPILDSPGRAAQAVATHVQLRIMSRWPDIMTTLGHKYGVRPEVSQVIRDVCTPLLAADMFALGLAPRVSLIRAVLRVVRREFGIELRDEKPRTFHWRAKARTHQANFRCPTCGARHERPYVI